MSTEGLVKVIFQLSEPDIGDVSGEGMWAAPVGSNLYELQNSPWHARTVNWLDVVEAISEDEKEWPKFVRVVKRSGHKTIHLYIPENGQEHKQEILDECSRLGATYEGADGRLYALDFAPGSDVDPAIQYLEKLMAQDLADWRINEY